MKKILLASLFTLIASTTFAQTIQVQFTASVDHSAVGGTPAVPILTSYELEVLQAANTVPIKIVSLGKPTPTANVVNMPVAITPRLAAGSYIGRVVAVGPGGRSNPSNAVTFIVPLLPPNNPTNLIITVNVAVDTNGNATVTSATIQ